MPIGYTPNYFSQYTIAAEDEKKPAASSGLPNFAKLAADATAARQAAAAQAGRDALARSQAAGFSQLASNAAASRAASGGVSEADSRAAASQATDRYRRSQGPSVANLERFADSMASRGSPVNSQAARSAAGFTPPKTQSISEYVAGLQAQNRGTNQQRYASSIVSPYAGTRAARDYAAQAKARDYTSQPAYFGAPARNWANDSVSAADQQAASTGLPNYARLAEDNGRRNYANVLGDEAGDEAAGPSAATGGFANGTGGLPNGFGANPTSDLASLQQMFPNLGYGELVDAYLQYITTRGQSGRGAIDSAFEDRGVYQSSDRDYALDFFNQLLELEKGQGVAAIQSTGALPSQFTAPSGAAGTSGNAYGPSSGLPPTLPASGYRTSSYANR